MNSPRPGTWLAAAGLLALMTPLPIRAQAGAGVDGPRAEGAPDGRPMPRLDLRVGDPMPDVELFTGEGLKFRTSQLKGSHTVLVFGCLT